MHFPSRIDMAPYSPAAARPRSSPWLLLLTPALLLLAVAFISPLIALAGNSFHPGASMGRIGTEWTFANYARFLTDGFYLGIVGDTLLVGIAVVAISIPISYPVAYFLARTHSRWRATLTFLVLAPLLISVVVRNLGWIPILGDVGFVNWLLAKTGLVHEPVKLIYNLTGVLIGLVHALTPLMIMSLMTVIRKIGPELEEAAMSLGANPLRTFWHVVFPMSLPGLLTGSLLVFTMSISAYITPAVMGGRRVLLMAVFIEQQIRTVLNYPFGATAAVVLLAMAGSATLLALKVGKDKQ